MKRLPVWAGLIGAVWMVIAIERVSLRAILITDYVGLRTGMMIPQIGREIPAWQDFWIFNSWLVLTSALEWALVAFVVQFAIRKLSR
jgi:hypothetical protein